MQSEFACQASSLIEFDLFEAQWGRIDDLIHSGSPSMQIALIVASWYTVSQWRSLSQKYLGIHNRNAVGRLSAARNIML